MFESENDSTCAFQSEGRFHGNGTHALFFFLITNLKRYGVI